MRGACEIPEVVSIGFVFVINKRQTNLKPTKKLTLAFNSCLLYLVRMITSKRRNITLSDDAWNNAGKLAEGMNMSRSGVIEILLKYAVASGQMSFSKLLERVFADALEVLKKKK